MLTSQGIHLVGKASGRDKVNKEGTEGIETEMCERNFIIYEDNFFKVYIWMYLGLWNYHRHVYSIFSNLSGKDGNKILSLSSSDCQRFSLHLNQQVDLCLYFLLRVCVCCGLSHVWLSVTPWTIAHQTPLSMGFSRQEYWSGLSFLTPRELPNPGTEPMSLASPVLAGGLFMTAPLGDPHFFLWMWPNNKYPHNWPWLFCNFKTALQFQPEVSSPLSIPLGLLFLFFLSLLSFLFQVKLLEWISFRI